MSALILTLKHKLAYRLDMSPLSPAKLAGLKPDDISSIPLLLGEQSVMAGDLFHIQGDDASQMVLRQASPMMDYVGTAMQGGHLHIEGDVGHYLGLHLRGDITCSGHAGNFVGCQMQAGRLHVQGNVGDYAGGALVGQRHGMRGGTLIVNGNAGDRLGDQMRRGTILLDGHAGDYCGANMLAGTIAIGASVGQYCGYAMRRGTILLQQPTTLHPTWVDCGEHALLFLHLLFQSWRDLPSAFAQAEGIRVRRYVGDLAQAGNAEILLRL